MSSKATVDMAYIGPVLDGTMDVRDLAPALLKMGALLEDANRVLNGDRAQVHVLVKSGFGAGSFDVSLEMVQTLADPAKIALALIISYDARRLLDVLGIVTKGVGLIQLMKRLAGREIDSIIPTNNGNVNVNIKGDNNSIEISNTVVQLHKDPRLRQNVHGIVKPLDQKGIDRLSFSSAGQESVAIEKAERAYFAVSTGGVTEVTDITFTAVYRIVSAAFEPQIKWRLSDGPGRLTASIKDEQFLQEVAEGSRTFTNGDAIKAEMRFHQWIGPDGLLKSEHEVMRVVDHMKGQSFIQMALPEAEVSDDDEEAH